MVDEYRELGLNESNESNELNESNNMAHPSPVDVDTILKSLRLLPEFDGNQHVLTRFINLCDQIVITHFREGPGNELANLALFNGILNKVTGPAARLINTNGIPDTWQGVRNALINNFADHRDETALYSDLSLQTQGNNTPQEFYERCLNLFSTIMTYVSLHESVLTTVESKRALYSKLTLQAYLRGLKEPLGSRIRCMRPETMEKALEFVQEELNTLYIQQRNEGGSSKKEQTDRQVPPSTFKLPFNNTPVVRAPFNMFGPATQPIYNAPSPSRHQATLNQGMQGWRSNSGPPPFRGPSRTQQMFRAPPPNYNPQGNGFRMPPRPPQQTSNFNAPRPMSGVTPFVQRQLPSTGHDWRTHGNPPPSNYFKSREVNFNESGFDNDMYYAYNTYPEYEPYYYAYDQYPDYYDNTYEFSDGTVVEEVENPSSEQENFQKAPDFDKQK